ncbi:hypothetical protein [Methylobacter tundripaludum]|uniref:Uncharacterized protein n=1 Tax=Methylobacter tundripaludum (strain ATCC BAA-1195 / DSM 17260 / SV96) TaxID=697282 RepID=G3J0S4_METTV|nr:hypothetical protein [Methylobacter tundripaludum]EGW20796.1 hypothetical protein Mettu_3946 [Methylobacter tundripaludum SV96]
MSFNINYRIIPECYIDTNLVETITPPERFGSTRGYNHQRSCNKVIGVMKDKLNDDFSVGILDYDKRPLSHTYKFVLLTEKHCLKLYKHSEKNHYLIFHPPIEQWILDEAKRVGISLDDPAYDLPITLKELMDETKHEYSKNDQRFKRLFRALIKQDAIGINLLANWTRYLKEHPYNADKHELINL